MDSLSASQKHRRRHRLCDTSCQALQLSSCSESPQDCADSAAREACTCHFRPSACQDSPRSLPGAEGIVFVATGPVQAPMQLSAVTVEKIKHKHSRKESNFPLPSLTSAMALCSRPLEFIQPLATWAEAWQAIPGVSDWVMGIIK